MAGALSEGMNRGASMKPLRSVMLCIGVNNQYRGLSVEEYKGEVLLLLQKAIALAGGHTEKVFVVSIPDYGVTPFALTLNRPGISGEIDTFNSVMRESCSRLGIVYTDITPDSRQAAHDPELLAGDGLHPSGKAYHQWAEALFVPLQKLLSSGY
jgi:lysophospholipase L1-like esterase